MEGRRTKAVAVLAVLLAVVAGCSTDAVTQMRKSTRVRDQVMDAITTDRALAEAMTHRLVASDSLRQSVIEVMLGDEMSARYVLARIGHNTDAVDYVLQAALSDSIGRAHLVARMESIRKGLGLR